jgi:hypothetical protein
MCPAKEGTEVVIRKIRGTTGSDDESHRSRVVNETNVPTIVGRYMSLTLARLFLNLPLVSEESGETRRFTILGAIWENMWDYRLNTLGSVKMIDSEGFQHNGDLCEYHEYCSVVVPDTGQVIKANFPWPELELEAHAKTKGWVWFEELPEGVVPSRFIFLFNIFDPGQTSGWVKDSESFEFILAEHDEIPAREVDAWKRSAVGARTQSG